LVGAFLVHRILFVNHVAEYNLQDINETLGQLFVIAVSVLVLSLFTIFLLTIKKARKEQKPVWGPGSKLLLLNLLIPLITGGILISILALRGYYDVISPAFLIFYGLALVNAAKYTRPEMLGLGITEIILGLVAAIFSGYGLYLWALGFGILHIVYGLMYLKNERKNTEG